MSPFPRSINGAFCWKMLKITSHRSSLSPDISWTTLLVALPCQTLSPQSSDHAEGWFHQVSLTASSQTKNSFQLPFSVAFSSHFESKFGLKLFPLWHDRQLLFKRFFFPIFFSNFFFITRPAWELGGKALNRKTHSFFILTSCRYLFCRQLRQDIETGRLVCPDDTVAAQLGAYILQGKQNGGVLPRSSWFGRLIDWLVGYSIDRSIDWLIDWLLGVWSIDWLIGRLIDWLVADRLLDWLIDWLIDLLVSLIPGWVFFRRGRRLWFGEAHAGVCVWVSVSPGR